MKTNGNTVLITGGATGIGFALAETFIKEGNEVIICGRREHKLKEAKDKLPQIHTMVCDITKVNDRFVLYNNVKSDFKDINILVNNAGIGRMIDFKKGESDMREDEIYTNLIAPIHLSAHFIPDLLRHKESAIINVSSGLAFVPMAAIPVYCATKAAMHSFSISLRHQLKDTVIKIFEVIPPIVDTEFHKDARDKLKNRSIPPSVVAEETLRALEKDEYEIPIGMSKNLRMADINNFEQIFQGINR